MYNGSVGIINVIPPHVVEWAGLCYHKCFPRRCEDNKVTDKKDSKIVEEEEEAATAYMKSWMRQDKLSKLNRDDMSF